MRRAWLRLRGERRQLCFPQKVFFAKWKRDFGMSGYIYLCLKSEVQRTHVWVMINDKRVGIFHFTVNWTRKTSHWPKQKQIFVQRTKPNQRFFRLRECPWFDLRESTYAQNPRFWPCSLCFYLLSANKNEVNLKQFPHTSLWPLLITTNPPSSPYCLWLALDSKYPFKEDNTWSINAVLIWMQFYYPYIRKLTAWQALTVNQTKDVGLKLNTYSRVIHSTSFTLQCECLYLIVPCLWLFKISIHCKQLADESIKKLPQNMKPNY